MSDMKLTIIFYSKGGTNLQLAKIANEAAEVEGAEVRLRKVEELAPKEIIESDEGWKALVDSTKDIPVATAEDIVWADSIIFSVPTRFGVMASQMKQFLDTQGGAWSQGQTVNKVVSAMSSAQNIHGGQEATILSLYTTMMHWGAIIVPPGYTDDSIFAAGGNPYGTTATVNENGQIDEEVKAAVKHQTKRTLEVAKWVKKGQE